MKCKSDLRPEARARYRVEAHARQAQAGSFTFELEGAEAQQLIGDLKQAIEDLGLAAILKVELG